MKKLEAIPATTKQVKTPSAQSVRIGHSIYIARTDLGLRIIKSHVRGDMTQCAFIDYAESNPEHIQIKFRLPQQRDYAGLWFINEYYTDITGKLRHETVLEDLGQFVAFAKAQQLDDTILGEAIRLAA